MFCNQEHNEYDIYRFDTIDSTNAEAIRMVHSAGQSIKNSLIIAKQQTQGRGTKGRVWQSDQGNLYLSILLQITTDRQTDRQKYSQLSFLAANTTYMTIAQLMRKQQINIDIKLKWPNDVLLNGKKVAGILLESINFESVYYLVIGFGINIVSIPSLLYDRATSLLAEGLHVSFEHLITLLVAKFSRFYQQWLFENSFARTQKFWLKHAHNLNQLVTIIQNQQKITGVFTGINNDGAINLELLNGQVCSFAAVDVI